ncbi:hypothetical protein [Streptomyces sp. Inha503]|uniref:hypothetical protein n=1 Tax=Streptomyces sp. Inha503 TaxID=3383314 RepID=UPI0039A1D631
MNHNLAALMAATIFTWLGMVVGISLLETPLRFRALRAHIEQDAEATRLSDRPSNSAAAECWPESVLPAHEPITPTSASKC